MNSDKPYQVILEVKSGSTLESVFEILYDLREKAICDDLSRIRFNDCELVAGIYENSNQLINTYNGIEHGNKEEIVSNLPKECESIKLLIAMEYVNKGLARFGNNKFTLEEINNIQKNYIK